MKVFKKLKRRIRKWKEWRKWCNIGKFKQWLILFGFAHSKFFDYFVMSEDKK